ncbi:hypothetical protein V6N13_061843 [Hibiscus sabdariffa]
MKGKLKQLNRDPFGNVDSNYRALVDEIDQFDERLNGDELDDCELLHKRQLYSKLWAASRPVESVWRQKSRATWIAEGDKSTKFFHWQVIRA